MSALLVVGVGEQGDTRRAAAAAVSANYFSVLEVTPAQGRAFLPRSGCLQVLGRRLTGLAIGDDLEGDLLAFLDANVLYLASDR